MTPETRDTELARLAELRKQSHLFRIDVVVRVLTLAVLLYWLIHR